jgi:hypothetical protein
VWGVDRGWKQVSTASSVTWQGCGTWAASKRRVFGVPEANRGDGAGPGGVLRVQVGYSVVSELRLVFQREPEPGIQELSTRVSTMTWRLSSMAGGAGGV